MAIGGIELNNDIFGGYTLINEPATSLPQNLATAFSKVNSGLLGATYEPLWLVGSQVVNGTNYMLICKEVRVTKETKPMIVAMVINVPPVKTNVSPGSDGKLVKILEEAELSPELDKIFKSATMTLMGVGYKPVAYVGKQVVKGINHYFICEAKPIIVDPTPYPVVMCINVFEGQCSIVSISPMTGKQDGLLGYAFTW